MIGPEAKEINLKIHQAGVAVSLDRPSERKGKGIQEVGGPDQLRFAIVAGYDRNQVRASWQDGDRRRLQSFIGKIAVEVVTTAEICYRDSCVRHFEWLVRRKAQLGEEAPAQR